MSLGSAKGRQPRLPPAPPLQWSFPASPESSGTPELCSNLELPCLHTAQHPQKHPQRAQHSAGTPAFWAKLLITNAITTTQTNSTIWLHHGVHLTRIIWSYICVQAFPYSHAQGCFTFIFMLFCNGLLGYALPSFTMCHLCRCCNSKVIMAAHQQQGLVTSKRKQRFEKMHA